MYCGKGKKKKMAQEPADNIGRSGQGGERYRLLNLLAQKPS